MISKLPPCRPQISAVTRVLDLSWDAVNTRVLDATQRVAAADTGTPLVAHRLRRWPAHLTGGQV